MARLIEVDNASALPVKITIERGDLLLFKASGGNVDSGFDVVELIGPFLSVLMLSSGDVIAPMGAPNSILFLARSAGRARIKVITGDPFFAPLITELEVFVGS
jgi:hypothetical protein